MNRILPAIFASIFVPCAFAGKPMTFATGDGAIRDYGPVAYFVMGEPTPGKNKYSIKWQGAIYKFSSTDNLALFKSDPQRYAPQYGGYCAYAAVKGAIANTDPEAWTIVNGKLFLNFSPAIKKRWSKDIPGHIKAANKNWPGVLN
ncbi:MAG: YHS domain-containing protein [Gammaproteobacteria bacterium]|nr:YHS domain-containing protein [Gammaproteobacteria bacterium]